MADSAAVRPLGGVTPAAPSQTAEPTPLPRSPTTAGARLVSQQPVLQPVSQPVSHSSPSTLVAHHVPESRPLATTSGNAGVPPGGLGAPPQDATPKPVFTMKRTGGATLPLPLPTSTSEPPSTTSVPSHATFAEPEPAQIVSDILPPQPLRPPSTPSSGRPGAAPTPRSTASDGVRKTKYATPEERRKATSLALKQRWAAGLMDHVHKKATETLERKRRAEDSLASLSGVSKPSTPLGAYRHASSSAFSPRRSPLPPLPPGFTTPHHLFRSGRPLAQFARMFQGRPTPAAPAQTAGSGSGTSSEERLEAPHQPSSATPDVEMAGTELPPSGVATLSNDQAIPGPAVAPKDEDSEYSASEGEGDVSSDIDDAQAVDGEAEEQEGDQPGHSGHRAIEMATEDRPYMRWRDDDGSLKVTYGTLVPEGYKLSDDIPGYPWVCPIRSCRKAFAKAVQLGGHFIRAHRGALLHDNQDGTLSERGRRRLRQADKSSPAIVISRGPADPPDEPVVATTCPTSVLPPQRSGGPAAAGIAVSAPQSPSQYEPDSKAGDPASLWSYIESHLVKHKGGPIPAKGYVHKLLELPRVRDVEWNPTWLATHPFNDTNPRDVSALIIQVTGEHAPNPCGRCRTGKGPFASCVMISAKTDSAPLTTVWSCANCFYHFGQTYCTHKDWGKARAESILSARGEGPPPNVQDEAEEEEGDGGGRDLEEVTDVDDNDAMDYTMAGDLPSVNGIPVGIAEAERGRKYDEWPTVTGEMGSLFGALLPAKYQMDNTIPGRSWACPVRSCRKAFCSRGDLGFHFKRAHCAAILNDNCDGTFTEESVYRDRRECIGRGGKILVDAPPVVVSRRALKRAGPPPKAQLPTYLIATTPARPAPELNNYPKPKTTDPKPKRLDNKETPGLWDYVQSHLTSTIERPSNTAVKELLMLPKQRELEYNQHRRATQFEEEASRDIASLVMQVVGDEAPDPCTRCRQGKGPFAGCMVVPDMARHTKTRYPCCANCLYRGKKLYCSVMAPGRARGREAAADAVQQPLPPVVESPVPAPALPGFPPRALRGARSAAQAPPPAPPSRQPSSSALISQGSFQGQDALLEMEEWEVAPGRIRETAGEADGETIAFSKPYLSTPHPVPVCADVSFRVDTVMAGATLQLDAQADTTRLCSVAAGKVRVTMGDEAEFVVGPHGMFKVRAGVGCVVRNRMYLDAVVHTVVLAGFE